MATLYKVRKDDDSVTEYSVSVAPVNGDGSHPKFTLAELQAFVGGMIETVEKPREKRSDKRIVMVFNENGRHLSLIVNRSASKILQLWYLKSGRKTVDVVGNALVCHLSEIH